MALVYVVVIQLWASAGRHCVIYIVTWYSPCGPGRWNGSLVFLETMQPWVETGSEQQYFLSGKKLYAQKGCGNFFFQEKKRSNPLLVCAQFHRPRYSFGVAWRVSTKRVKRIVKFDTLNSWEFRFCCVVLSFNSGSCQWEIIQCAISWKQLVGSQGQVLIVYAGYFWLLIVQGQSEVIRCFSDLSDFFCNLIHCMLSFHLLQYVCSFVRVVWRPLRWLKVLQDHQRNAGQ